MTVRRIPRSDLRQPDASLFADHTVVLMTPVTADATWAAECAWELARAATADARRVALIDLSLEHPVLDPHPPSEGIVDAFLYGASLNHVAQAQDTPGLHFVSAGSYAANPAEVWESPRWSRLAMGFAQEGALLLAFVPPSALE
ncbi:MAG: P-loop NTPase family protein, partial [Planctomycetota bacterium]